MIKVNDPKVIISGGDFSTAVDDVKEKGKETSKNSFTEQPTVEDKILQGNPMNGLKSLGYPTNQIKARLRKRITSFLVEGFKVPELVDGLVEYLFEIIKEDPSQAHLFGIYD